jgi:predicted dehydrogenase
MKSLDFKKKFNSEKAYGSYLDLVKDDEVELVYIATVNSAHYENMRLCLEHNKNVICEKPFALNYSEALEVINLAKQKNLYISEALWTSYMPFNQKLLDILKNEKIKSFYGVFNCPVYEKERIKSNALGGGALLDLGVYPISFALRCFGFSYKNIFINNMYYSDSFIDVHTDISIVYDDFEARCICNVAKDFETYIKIETENLDVYIDSSNNPTVIKITNIENMLTNTIDVKAKYTGYEYEFMDAYKAIHDGLTESRMWSTYKTLELMRILDQIRIKSFK